MAIQELKDGSFVLKGVRLSYPHLFTPSAAVASATKKYSGNFILEDEDDVAWVQEQVDGLIKSELKGKRPADQSIALRENDNGDSFIKAANKGRPALRTASLEVVDSEDDSPFYPGCYVNVRMSLKANNLTGQKSIYAQLHALQFAGHGERLDGGMSEADAVAEFEAMDDDDDFLGEAA